MAECPENFAPQTQNCSGRGVCLGAYFCACEPGWTGQADLVFGEPSCAVHITASRALWGICACSCFLGLVHAIRFLRIRLSIRHITNSRAPELTALFVIASMFFLVISSLIRTIDPTRTVGKDVTVTVTYSLGYILFWCGCNAFVYIFLGFGIKQARMFGKVQMLEDLKATMKRLAPITATVGAMHGFLPLGVLGSTSQLTTRVLASTFYISDAILVLVAGLWLIPSFSGPLRREMLEIASKHDETSAKPIIQFAKKIELLEVQMRLMPLPLSSVFFLIGFWPFLQFYGSSYVIPITQAMSGVTSIMALEAASPILTATSRPTAESKSSKRLSKEKSSQFAKTDSATSFHGMSTGVQFSGS